MVKTIFSFAFAFACALSVLVLARSTYAKSGETIFHVEGRVYCDTCGVNFETRISEGLDGAEIKLDCRDSDTEKETYSVDGKTNKDGWYKLSVEGDHEKDICEVSVKTSPREDCKKPIEEKARIVCTDNSGMHSETRYANPIGFVIESPLEECKEVLDELGITGVEEAP